MSRGSVVPWWSIRYWPALLARRPETIGGLTRDSASYALSKAVPGVAGLISVLVFVRMLGEAQYGRLALAIATVNLLAAFFTGWVNQAVLRFYSQLGHLDATWRVMWRAVGGSVLAGSLVLLAGRLVFPQTAPAYSVAGLALMLALLAVVSVYQFRLVVFQAQLRPGRAVAVGAFQAVASVVLPVGLFFAVGRRYEVALGGLVLAYLGPALWRDVRARGGGKAGGGGGGGGDGVGTSREGPSPSAGQIGQQFWRYGWALSLWFAVTAVLPVSDRYFIQHFYGFEATGSYSAVYDTIVRGFSLLLFPITLAAHPRIMRLWNDGDRAGARSVWRWAVAGQVVAFAGLLLIVLPFRGWVVRTIVPGGGAALEGIAAPLLVGGFLWQVALLAHKPLEVAGRTLWMLGAGVVALGINVAANVFLLPRYGIMVTAVAYTVTASAYIVLTLAMGARHWTR